MGSSELFSDVYHSDVPRLVQKAPLENTIVHSLMESEGLSLSIRKINQLYIYSCKRKCATYSVNYSLSSVKSTRVYRFFLMLNVALAPQATSFPIASPYILLL